MDDVTRPAPRGYPANPEDFQREMARIRCELGEGVDQIVENARIMSSWRYYVRTYPWVCLGAALAVGYLVVPRRVEIVRPDAKEIARLAKKNKIVVQDSRKAHDKAQHGIAGAALGFLANAAVRAMLSYAGQQIGKVVSQQPANGEASPPGDQSAQAMR